MATEVTEPFPVPGNSASKPTPKARAPFMSMICAVASPTPGALLFILPSKVVIPTDGAIYSAFLEFRNTSLHW